MKTGCLVYMAQKQGIPLKSITTQEYTIRCCTKLEFSGFITMMNLHQAIEEYKDVSVFGRVEIVSTAVGNVEKVSTAVEAQILFCLFGSDLAKFTVLEYAHYIPGPPVHIYIKIMFTGTGPEHFLNLVRDIHSHAFEIEEALDTFAFSESHFTLSHVACDYGGDGKMLAQQFLSSPHSSWQLTFELSYADDLDLLSIGHGNSDGYSDCCPVSTDMETIGANAGDKQ